MCFNPLCCEHTWSDACSWCLQMDSSEVVYLRVIFGQWRVTSIIVLAIKRWSRIYITDLSSIFWLKSYHNIRIFVSTRQMRYYGRAWLPGIQSNPRSSSWLQLWVTQASWLQVDRFWLDSEQLTLVNQILPVACPNCGERCRREVWLIFE